MKDDYHFNSRFLSKSFYVTIHFLLLYSQLPACVGVQMDSTHFEDTYILRLSSSIQNRIAVELICTPNGIAGCIPYPSPVTNDVYTLPADGEAKVTLG